MSKMVKYYKGDLVEFEILKLVDFYDPILRQPTLPIKFDTLEEQKRAAYLSFSLSETLSELHGLGLSANQVGLKERICAINMGTEIWILINPEILETSGEPAEYGEGCLSYPGLYLKLKRPSHIKVRFQAIGGQVVEQEFDGLTAVCVQHEIDHLDGLTIKDRVYNTQVVKKVDFGRNEKIVMKSKEGELVEVKFKNANKLFLQGYEIV